MVCKQQHQPPTDVGRSCYTFVSVILVCLVETIFIRLLPSSYSTMSYYTNRRNLSEALPHTTNDTSDSKLSEEQQEDGGVARNPPPDAIVLSDDASEYDRPISTGRRRTAARSSIPIVILEDTSDEVAAADAVQPQARSQQAPRAAVTRRCCSKE